MNPDKAWSAVLRELQLQMTQATFDTWLRDSVLLGVEDGVFVVGVKNAYAKDWLEHRLKPTVVRTIARLTGAPAQVEFRIRPADPDPPAADASISREDLGAGQQSSSTKGAATSEDVPRKIDRDVPPDARVSIQLITFDPRDEGFVQISNYALQFWQPYLAERERQAGIRTPGTAFWLWATLRSCAAHWMTTRSPEWPSIQTLADICANKNRHRILGRAARRGRKPTIGAIQILEQENIIRTSTRGAGSEVIYHFRVLDRLPVLTPAQVAILTPRLHDRHRLAIARCKLNLNEWHQLTLATLIEDTG